MIISKVAKKHLELLRNRKAIQQEFNVPLDHDCFVDYSRNCLKGSIKNPTEFEKKLYYQHTEKELFLMYEDGYTGFRFFLLTLDNEFSRKSF